MSELERLRQLHTELNDKYEFERVRERERESAIRHAVRIETLGEARHLVATQIRELEELQKKGMVPRGG